MAFLTKKQAFLTFQGLISLAAIIFVVFKLIRFDDWHSFGNMVMENRLALILLVFFQFILLVVNLGLESLKWQALSSPVATQSYRDAIFQVLKGLQLGLVTPARTGEPLARALLIKEGARTKAFFLSLFGSVLQNLVLASGGVLGILFFTRIPEADMALFHLLRVGISEYVAYFVGGVLLIAILTYRLLRFFRSHPLVRRIAFYVLVIRQLGKIRFLWITGFTFARYSIYCFQLWLILYFFGIAGQAGDMWLVSVYFAVITFIPSVAIADLGIRSSVALFLFGMLSTNSPGIVVSVFLLWFFNIALPVIVSSFFLRGMKNQKPDYSNPV
jgi:hypothetical protein